MSKGKNLSSPFATGGSIRGVYPARVPYKLKKRLLTDGGLWAHYPTLFAVIDTQKWLDTKIISHKIES